MAHYLDTSALVKLVVSEPESPALRAWLVGGQRGPISSDLSRTELVRAVRRVAPERMMTVRAVLDALTLIQISSVTFEQAGRLDPVGMRSLDAVHLAVALEVGDDLEGLVTYDGRLADAARANGVGVLAPT